MIRLPEGLRILLIEDSQTNENDFLQLLQGCDIEQLEFRSVTDVTGAFDLSREFLPEIIFAALPILQKDVAAVELKKWLSSENIPLVTIASTRPKVDDHVDIFPEANDQLYRDELSAVMIKKSIQYCLAIKRKDQHMREIVERFELLAKATNDIVW
ncbi:MAG: hypothetical protein EOO06_08425, partial [Chitinophagaceae bacterium]